VLPLDVTLSLFAVLTSLACMVFLFRAYGSSRLRLLLWSALCFVFLSLNNMLLFIDLVTPPEMDFRPYRLGVALVGVLFLLYGFVWEAE
jgi:hypothetical protein